MTRKLNPDLIGKTEKEKAVHHATNYREENRSEFRKYQREYQRKYRLDPRLVLRRLQRRAAEVEAILTKWELMYQRKIARHAAEFQSLTTQIKEQQHLVDTKQTHERKKSNG